MAEITLRRVSALEPVYREGVYGAACEAPGIVIRERRGLLLRVVRGDPGAAGTAVTVLALALAPGEWMVSSPENGATPALDACVVVDVSHGRTVLRISGNDARRLLAKGCALDVHPAAFAANACAQTAIARINVLIHRVGDGDAYDLYCARSTARSLWHWITQGAAEYGYRVDPPLLEGGTGR